MPSYATFDDVMDSFERQDQKEAQEKQAMQVRIAMLERRNAELEELFRHRAQAGQPGGRHVDAIVCAASEKGRIAYEQGKRITELEATLAKTRTELAQAQGDFAWLLEIATELEQALNFHDVQEGHVPTVAEMLSERRQSQRRR